MMNEVETIKTEPLNLCNLERKITLSGNSRYIEKVENLHCRSFIISTVVNSVALTSNIKPDNNYYNLFVLDGEDFAKGYFTLKRNELLKNLDRGIEDNYSLMNFSSLQPCLDYPCIFANKNAAYKKADDNQNIYFGYLVKIEPLEQAYKFYYSMTCILLQSIFNENTKAMDIQESMGDNELDKIHWSIKHVNVIDRLQKLGYNVASY